MKLKIFSDPDYIPEGVEPFAIFQPFWSKSVNKYSRDNSPWSNSLAEYRQTSHSLFEITSLEEADLAILPFDWLCVRGNTWAAKHNKRGYHLGIEFAKRVKEYGKSLAIFYTGDCSHEQIPIKDAFVFRQSLIASQRGTRDFAMTAAYEDLTKHYLDNEICIREKRKTPVIGFDGCVDSGSWEMTLKTFAHQIAMLAKGNESFFPYEGHKLRTKAVKYLSNSSLVKTNFVIRNNMAFFDAEEIEQKLKVRREYVQNMVDSDYILCIRGRANFSLRFFEALCCGRIPIFVNTDCILPYNFIIDWKKYCVWLEKEDIPHIAEKIADFHHNISSQEFMDLQFECRKLWKEWLSNEGFLTNFYRFFK